MAADFTLKVGDRSPSLGRQILLDDDPVDLGAGTVTFTLVAAATGTAIIDAAAAVVADAATGQVRYDWTAQNAIDMVAGIYLGRFVATLTGGLQLTAPNSGNIVVEVYAVTGGEATYFGDPSGRAIDAVRFLIQDTNMAAPKATDAEITYLLDQWAEDAYMAAAALCDIRAGVAVSSGITSKSVGGLSIAYDNQADENWRALGKSIRALRLSTGAILPRLASTSTEIVGKSFWLGQHDFEGAGNTPFDETSGLS